MDEEFVDNFEDEYSDDSDYDDTEVIIGSKVNEDIHLLMKGYKKKKKLCLSNGIKDIYLILQ